MIRKLQAKLLNIPFKGSFTHASAARSQTQSIWVEAESDTGARGFGEGCPREYVTGESAESALSFIRGSEAEVLRIGSLHELKAWVDSHRTQIDANPAAWCAIELALLDVMARDSGQTVEALLSLPPVEGRFYYSAVLGAEAPTVFQKQLERYLQLGFRNFKAKLSGEKEIDGVRLAMLKAAAGAMDSLRLDANNLWKSPAEALGYLSKLETSAFAIEEPLAPGRYPELRQIADAAGIKIILDESFLRYGQVEDLSPSPGPWIINLRISKMGGLLRSWAIAEQAQAINLPLIIGCQVGETSLLTRAALTVASGMKKQALLAQEGAFGTHLLQRDVVASPLMFGAAGCLDLTGRNFATAAGFGLEPTEGSIG